SIVVDQLCAPPLAPSPMQRMFLFISFLFMRFRALMRQWALPTPFLSIISALFSMPCRGSHQSSPPTSQQSRSISRHVANLPFCFQQLPRCPSRNSFPFILLHRCRGWVGG